MKLYVAGKYEHRFKVKMLMRFLRQYKHEITMDWTVGLPTDVGYPLTNCLADVKGVQGADVYVGVFIEDYIYKGAYVEFGIALGLNKPCVLIGHAADTCIFTAHPLVTHVEADDLSGLLNALDKINIEILVSEGFYDDLQRRQVDKNIR
jgi:hypothetical protein